MSATPPLVAGPFGGAHTLSGQIEEVEPAA